MYCREVHNLQQNHWYWKQSTKQGLPARWYQTLFLLVWNTSLICLGWFGSGTHFSHTSQTGQKYQTPLFLLLWGLKTKQQKQSCLCSHRDLWQVYKNITFTITRQLTKTCHLVVLHSKAALYLPRVGFYHETKAFSHGQSWQSVSPAVKPDWWGPAPLLLPGHKNSERHLDSCRQLF